MGDPIYEAMRAKERAEYERERAIAEAGKQAALAFVDFVCGRAALHVMPYPTMGVGSAPAYSIRFVRDSKPGENHGSSTGDPKSRAEAL